jgi:hypothetical protein
MSMVDSGSRMGASGCRRAEPLPVVGEVTRVRARGSDAANPSSLADLRGSVWAASIFFPRVHRRPCGDGREPYGHAGEGLSPAAPALQAVKLASFSTDPDADSGEPWHTRGGTVPIRHAGWC